MRYWLHLIILIHLEFPLHSQEGSDSISLLMQKSTLLTPFNADSALHYAKKANYLAEKNKNINALMKTQLQVGFIYYNSNNFDRALQHFKTSLEIARTLNNPEGEAIALNRIGNAYQLKTNFLQALEHYILALEINSKNNYQSEIARTLVNLANTYSSVGQYQRSIEHFLKAMDIHEKTGDEEGMGWASLGTARLFKTIGMLEKAMQYAETALNHYRRIEKASGKTTGITLCLNEMGSIYQRMGDTNRALEYVRMALEINERNNNLHGQAANHINLGSIFLEQGNISEAGFHLQKALQMKIKVNDSIDLALLNRYIAEVELKNGNHEQAIRYLNTGMQFALKQKQLSEIEQNYFAQSKVYQATGNYKTALIFFQKHSNYRDSLNATEISKLEMQYEFDKREKEQEYMAQQREAFHQLQLDRQQVVTLFFIVAFLLAGALALFVYYAYKEKRRTNMLLVAKNEEIVRQKNEIEQQKEEIEQQRDYVTKQRDQIAEQQRLITDSILYASRIQNAVLPTTRILKELPWPAFILYKPKNIVSGDFYWSSVLKDGRILLAVADCTGHGVPGAFMSMLGITLLREVIAHETNPTPSLILSKLREMVIDSLIQRTGQIEQSDGIDMAICIINPEDLQMEFAGAYNSVIVVRNNSFDSSALPTKARLNQCNGYNLLEIRGDKMPVGHYAIDPQPFSNSSFQLAAGDSLYLFTDGYIDQFGGLNNTKFLLPAFKDLLSTVQHLSLENQCNELDKTIEQFKGPQKQVDDMLVLGLKL